MSSGTRVTSRARVKAPTVLQMEATECGAASLAMVLGYHGRFVPLEELRRACGVTRDGSSAPGIINAAREYGLEPRGYRKEPDDLWALPLPLIAFWNFYHFLVVEGHDEEGVYLNDPERGRWKASHDEFDASFTGIVLSFDKGPDFRVNERPGGVFKRLGARLGNARSTKAYLVIAGLAVVVPGLLFPSLVKVFVDDFLVRQHRDVVPPLLIALAVGTLLSAGLTWLQQHYLLRLRTRLTVQMTSDFVWHVFRLPMSFFSQRSAGDVASRVGLNDQISTIMSGPLASNVLDMFAVVFFAGLMFYFDPVLAAATIALASLNFLALKVVNRKTAELGDKVLREEALLESTGVTGLRTIESLKSAGAESEFFGRWAGFFSKVVNARQAVDVRTQALGAVPAFLGGASIAAIIGVGGYRVIDGSLSLGTLVAFQVVWVSFLTPIAALVSLGGVLSRVGSSISRLDDVLEYGVDPAVTADVALPPGPTTSKLAGHVEVDGISFGYNPLAPPLIAGFSTTLLPGQRIAIVGATGSGKSTIARVVSGLYPAWEGEVRFDHVPRPAIPRLVLGSSVALVDQEIALFGGTIRDNLTLWDPLIPEADVIQAAKDACIHEDIAARPGGYSSRVEEGGRNFSGGERQRLEIARALVRNPTILVLDEATSALDPTTEVRIDRNLRRRGCTCLIVAQRVSTIRDCDEIIVLDRGKVVQRGTHEELKSQEGLYAHLVGSESG